ncbi:uncharacterized protein LOC134250543 isoform X2 [Saccostrea cucullata]|uniref:uncharacterized protein LOC134250543 isoform X2 n=1 Tax=Saccostrea cuccullata TaxID=36930 RepID=UPI002ED2272D
MYVKMVFTNINRFLMLQVLYLIICFLLLSVAGGTQDTALETVTITKCDGQRQDGSVMIVNYQEINLQCTCDIETHFTGILQFTSTRKESNECSSEISISEKENVSNSSVLPCISGKKRTSITFNVSTSSILVMVPKYINSTSGLIHQEIKIFEEKSYKGSISVTCGNSFSALRPTTITADDHAKTHHGSNPSKNVTGDINFQEDNIKTPTPYIQTISKALTIDTVIRDDSINTNTLGVDTTIRNDNMKTEVNFETSPGTTSKAGTERNNTKSLPTYTLNTKIQNDYRKTEVDFTTLPDTTSKATTASENTKSHRATTLKALAVDTTIKIDYIQTEIDVQTSSKDTTSKAGTASNNVKSDSATTYLIYGISGAAVFIIILGIICVVVWRLKRRQSVMDIRHDQQNNGTYDAELPDNPLYHGTYGTELPNNPLYHGTYGAELPDNPLYHGTYNAELPDNPLYHSYQPLENSEHVKRNKWSKIY